VATVEADLQASRERNSGRRVPAGGLVEVYSEQPHETLPEVEEEAIRRLIASFRTHRTIAVVSSLPESLGGRGVVLDRPLTDSERSRLTHTETELDAGA
jgi:hypothetical protein